MAQPESTSPSLRQVLGRLGLLIGITYALVLTSFWLPPVPLDSGVALAAFWVAHSGGAHGLPYVALALMLALALRPDRELTIRRRVIEGALITVIGVAALGGGARINEHLLKPSFGVPRPNIVELARRGKLGTTPARFYALGDKRARSSYLVKRLRALGRGALALDPRIRAHWAEETGFSFPSGHSFAALCTATFFLGLALMLVRGRLRWLFYALAPWALAVCFSRPILRVHSPTDISVGALEGILTGSVALLIAWTALGRRAVVSSAR